MEKKESFYIGETVKWYRHHGKKFWRGVPKKLKTELPYDAVTSLPGIHSKKMKSPSYKYIYNFIFIAALFTKAKKQLRYLPQLGS